MQSDARYHGVKTAIALSLVGAVLIFLFGTAIVTEQEENRYAWLNTALSAAGSILGALAVALGVYLYQVAHHEREERERISRLLRAELAHYSGLFDPCSADPKIMFLQPIALSEARKSGYFCDRIVHGMLGIERQIALYNKLVDVYFTADPAEEDRLVNKATGEGHAVGRFSRNLLDELDSPSDDSSLNFLGG